MHSGEPLFGQFVNNIIEDLAKRFSLQHLFTDMGRILHAIGLQSTLSESVLKVYSMVVQHKINNESLGIKDIQEYLFSLNGGKKGPANLTITNWYAADYDYNAHAHLL